LVSGFGSVRRFNAAFTSHYGLSPGALRREGATRDATSEVRLGYRPPYDVDAMLGFFRTRAIEGVVKFHEALAAAMDEQPNPLSPVLRGEGRGEGPLPEHHAGSGNGKSPSPHPSPLSTGERGQGAAPDLSSTVKFLAAQLTQPEVV